MISIFNASVSTSLLIAFKFTHLCEMLLVFDQCLLIALRPTWLTNCLCWKSWTSLLTWIHWPVSKKTTSCQPQTWQRHLHMNFGLWQPHYWQKHFASWPHFSGWLVETQTRNYSKLNLHDVTSLVKLILQFFSLTFFLLYR